MINAGLGPCWNESCGTCEREVDERKSNMRNEKKSSFYGWHESRSSCRRQQREQAMPCNQKLTEIEPFGFDAATYAKYWITFLVFSVLPAPDSPVHRIDWSSRSVNWERENWICVLINLKCCAIFFDDVVAAFHYRIEPRHVPDEAGRRT